MKKILVGIMAILLLISCQSVGQKSKPIDYRETPAPTDTNYCGAAEKHLNDLCKANPEENLYCCQASSSTKKNKTFKQFCEETQAAGIQLNPKCLSTITACEQINGCLGTK